MKPSILYYSDCPFFAGCENMIANFLNEDYIKENFYVSFAFNYSDKYKKGLDSRVRNKDFKEYPLRLMKQISYIKPEDTSKMYFYFHKIFYAFYIPLNKYISIIVNILILFFFLKKQKIDVLHINNGGYPAANSCYAIVIASKLAGVKNLIYVVNNIADNYKHPYRWLDYPLDLLVKKWVTIFVTGSEFAGDKLKDVLKIDNSKHCTINNAIKPRKVTIPKDKFRKQYSVPSGKYLISVIANLEKRKGHIFLLKAILELKQSSLKELNAFFVFEGEGPEKTILKKFIKNNNLKSDVLMIDSIPDIFNLFNASDIVVLPSIANEDFPNVVLEAMSLGKPVIGTKIAGMLEQIDNNETGFIVEPKRPDELKQSILKLISNPKQIHEFSIRAKKKFENLYKTQLSVNKYLNLYKSLIYKNKK